MWLAVGSFFLCTHELLPFHLPFIPLPCPSTFPLLSLSLSLSRFLSYFPACQCLIGFNCSTFVCALRSPRFFICSHVFFRFLRNSSPPATLDKPKKSLQNFFCSISLASSWFPKHADEVFRIANPSQSFIFGVNWTAPCFVTVPAVANDLTVVDDRMATLSHSDLQARPPIQGWCSATGPWCRPEAKGWPPRYALEYMNSIYI